MAAIPIKDSQKNSTPPQQVPLKVIKSFHVMAEILECIYYCTTPFSILTNTLGIRKGTQVWEEAAAYGDVTT